MEERREAWRRMFCVFFKEKALEMLKRASLRHDSKEIQSVHVVDETVGLSEWEDGISPGWEGKKKREDGSELPPPGLPGGDLSCLVELLWSFWVIWVFFQFILWLMDLYFYIIADSGNLPSVTKCGWLRVVSWPFSLIRHHLTPTSCKQGFFCYFQKFIAEKYFEKILSCGGLSVLTLAITQIKNGSSLWEKEK